MKFKIGDRVITTKNLIPWFNKGDEGIVIEDAQSIDETFRVRFSDEKVSWFDHLHCEKHEVYNSPLYQALK